jgi:ubiquinone/menaquinone biosynthesis C-methylase UbiE
MDYDKTEIAATYNRGRHLSAAVLDQWMNMLAAHVELESVRNVLDLGCGTGRFSKSLADRFNARVVGIDPSRKMLGQARGSLSGDRVLFVCSSAEALPLPPNSVDLIFISMVFHHFANPPLAVQECNRVLRDTGRVCLRTGSREMISRYPYVPFFPTSRVLLEKRLPTLAFQRTTFEAAGFTTLASEVVIQEIASDYASYAEKLSARADSILLDLDDFEFNSGLHALRSSAASNAGRPVTEPIDVLVFGKND